MHALLKAEKIPFIKERTIGRLHADVFIEPATIIELNGCYWHFHTKCQKTPSAMHKKAMASDARRYAFFQRLGFKVHVIWECQVEKDPEAVRQMLRRIAGLE